ncbi:Hint domain-containing protein [Paracoccus sp. R86501]|uniref:Hint domain-containing protein n=1 Tax=Paracoccus sp. R86501 TaxID=3101711 RepID=UPI003670D155
MAFLTEAPAGLVNTGTISAPILDFPASSVLNNLGSSDLIDSYNVQDDTLGPNVVVAGDFLAPVVAGTPIPGTYLGSGELTTLAIDLNLIVASVSVKLKPIAVNYFQRDDGTIFVISDGEISDADLTFEVTTTTFLTGSITADVNLSGLDAVTGGLLTNILDTALIQYAFDANGQLTLDNAEIDIVCFARGTMIRTIHGDVAIQDLAVGDMIVTRDDGAQPLRWIGSQRLDAIDLAAHPRLTPIRIRAGALGDGMPQRDLVVSPQHRVLVRSKIAQRMFGADELLLAAKQLLALEGFELADDLDQVEYFHIMFDRHQVIMSNGAPTESLYCGAQALQMVGPAARQELLSLFPQLAEDDMQAEPARAIPHDKRVRKLAQRHQDHARVLYQ